MKEPECYNDKDKSKFLAWWQTVTEYMDFHPGSFTTDEQKIAWVSSIMTDKAIEWHQKRGENAKLMGLADTWAAYTEALKLRFKDSARAHNDWRKMQELKYDHDISAYVTKLQEYNYSVSQSGIALRELVGKAIPQEIMRMIYARYGTMPDEDVDFFEAVVHAGLIHETMWADPSLKSRH